MKRIILFVLCILLMGCATTANYKANMDSWLGADINKFISANGYAHKTGDNVYQWSYGSNYTTPTTIQQGNLRCNTYLETDPTGRIIQWRSEGNNCVAKVVSRSEYTPVYTGMSNDVLDKVDQINCDRLVDGWRDAGYSREEILHFLNTVPAAQNCDKNRSTNSYEEDTLKLVNMIVSEQTFTAMMDMMFINLRKMSPPGYPEEFWERLRTGIDREEWARDIYVPLYMNWFSHEEIKGLISNYGQPVMQKVLSVQTELMKEASNRVQAWSSEYTYKLIKQMMNEGYTFP